MSAKRDGFDIHISSKALVVLLIIVILGGLYVLISNHILSWS